MAQNQPRAGSLTSQTQPQNKVVNISYPTAGLSAVVKSHDRRSVVIAGEKLNEILERLYNIGINKVELVIEVDGRQVVVTGSVYKKTDNRTGRSYYCIYPLGADQALLRSKYLAFRGNAEKYSKTPLPILVYSIMPKM